MIVKLMMKSYRIATRHRGTFDCLTLTWLLSVLPLVKIRWKWMQTRTTVNIQLFYSTCESLNESSWSEWGSFSLLRRCRKTRHLHCPHRLMAQILNDNVFKSYEYEARQSRPIHISLQNILLALWALCCCCRLLLTSIIWPGWAGFPGPN